jgi:hypothetical protein
MNISNENNKVEFSVGYGFNGMIDCRRLAQTLADIFSIKNGVKITGEINPGDSCCGIEIITPSPEDAAELRGQIESRLSLEKDGEELKTPREIFDLGADIIGVELPEAEKLRQLLTKEKDGNILVGTWANDQAEYVKVEIPEAEKEDYLKGQVMFWKVAKREDHTTIQAALIPKSRIDEVWHDIKGQNAMKVAQAMTSIGKECNEWLEKPFTTDWGPIVEKKSVGITDQPKKEATKEMGVNPKLGEHAKTHSPPAEVLNPEPKQLTPELAETVEAILVAQAGGTRIPRDKYRTMLAQAKPYLAKEGGLTKSAYLQAKGTIPSLIKAAKAHRQSKSTPAL